jgi:hypothetical protein
MDRQDATRRPPERLWKYRAWNDYTRALLTRGDTYFSTVEQLNDPFEFRWREQFPRDPEKIDWLIREACAARYPNDSPSERSSHFRHHRAEIIQIIAAHPDGVRPTEIKPDWGVLCLSEICDDILMWSHYAQNHRGVCLGIRTECMGRKILRPVNYVERVPVIDTLDYLRREKRETYTRLSLTKAAHWSYEKEWRTIDRPGVHTFPACVDRVIIGAMADESTRQAVRNAVAAAAHPIEVMQADLSSTYYALDVRTLSDLLLPAPAVTTRKNRKKQRAKR